MALVTRNTRVDDPTFLARHARFIVPVPWLLVAAMRAADAVRTGAGAGRDGGS